jgi:hypothetical protein
MVKSFILLLSLIFLVLFFGCTELKYSNIDNGVLNLNVGETKLVATYDNSFLNNLISGGCFPNYYILDKSIADYSQEASRVSNGFSIVGVARGETKLVFGSTCSTPDFNKNAIRIVVN